MKEFKVVIVPKDGSSVVYTTIKANDFSAALRLARSMWGAMAARLMVEGVSAL
jgi:hypothetical protein